MKRAYAYRLRAFVHFLKKNEEQTGKDFHKNHSLSEKEISDVNILLVYDLKLLNEIQPDAEDSIKAFRKNYFQF